ncbi:hypothetical protein R84981_002760 [Carnimonas sp. R-84981]|uniref:hypothetical protein n=1 Tax=Carnimonas bestiolae TaxID=3402172 RepID=UPI003EDC6D09
MATQKNQFNLRLKPGLSEWLAGQAEKQDRSKTWVVNHLIEQAMQNEQQQA